MDLNIVDLNNKKIDKFVFELDDNIQINRKVISQVVRWQLSKRRIGTASTKNRSLVAGSNKKPFKQKGTGNARAGTRTSPIWRGGGVIFGPTPKDWSISVPKKVRKLAILAEGWISIPVKNLLNWETIRAKRNNFKPHSIWEK